MSRLNGRLGKLERDSIPGLPLSPRLREWCLAVIEEREFWDREGSGWNPMFDALHRWCHKHLDPLRCGLYWSRSRTYLADPGAYPEPDFDALIRRDFPRYIASLPLSPIERLLMDLGELVNESPVRLLPGGTTPFGDDDDDQDRA